MSKLDFKTGIYAVQYRNSILKELFRKSIHLCSAFIPTLLDFAYWPVIILLSCALIFYSIAELLRMKGISIPVVSKITAVAARKRDENKFVLGPVTLVIGILISAFLWEPEFYRIGIYSLAFGDGLASLFGKLFGRIPIPLANGKTVAGSLTCFIAVYISSFCVCMNAPIALILGVTAMLIEVIPMLDFDNICIPVFIGGLSQFLINGSF